jgi:hypothetical protein
MPGTPLASLQLGRVTRSSQQMAAFGPFVDALEARCDGLLPAEPGSTAMSALTRTCSTGQADLVTEPKKNGAAAAAPFLSR